MLNRQINIITYSLIIFHKRNDLLGKACRIEIMKSYPFEAFNFKESGYKIRQFLLLIEIKSVITQVLSYKYEFLNS